MNRKMMWALVGVLGLSLAPATAQADGGAQRATPEQTAKLNALLRKTATTPKRNLPTTGNVRLSSKTAAIRTSYVWEEDGVPSYDIVTKGGAQPMVRIGGIDYVGTKTPTGWTIPAATPADGTSKAAGKYMWRDKIIVTTVPNVEAGKAVTPAKEGTINVAFDNQE
jgi:hypothetical protein